MRLLGSSNLPELQDRSDVMHRANVDHVGLGPRVTSCPGQTMQFFGGETMFIIGWEYKPPSRNFHPLGFLYLNRNIQSLVGRLGSGRISVTRYDKYNPE